MNNLTIPVDGGEDRSFSSTIWDYLSASAQATTSSTEFFATMESTAEVPINEQTHLLTGGTFSNTATTRMHENNMNETLSLINHSLQEIDCELEHVADNIALR
jgi:hypothetical protein